MEPEAIRMLAAAGAISLGVTAPAVAIGAIGYSAMQALGRNPEARGAIMINLILAVAFAEALGIYALIVAIILALIA